MTYISKDFLIKKFQQEIDENGIFMKRDITRRLGTNHETLRRKFGSTDNFAKIANREFKKVVPHNKKNISDEDKKIRDNKIIEKLFKKKIAWNKGKTHLTDDRLKNRMISDEVLFKRAQDEFNKNGKFLKIKLPKILGTNHQTIRNRFGNINNFANLANIQFKDYNQNVSLEERLGKTTARLSIEKANKTKRQKGLILTKDELIKEVKEKYILYGRFFRSDIEKIMSCNSQTIRNKFGNLDEFAKIANIKFKPTPTNRLGRNETKILDEIELEKGINLERQYSIAGRFIDGYDPINNVAYEVDEKHHLGKIHSIKDKIRETIITEKIGCNFVRIKDF